MTKETVTIEVPADAKITINGETWTPPKTNGLPVPTEDNKGWVINGIGPVMSGVGGYLEDMMVYASRGSWFPSLAQAELAQRQRATKRLMEDISAKEGFVDWGDAEQIRYSLYLNHKVDRIAVTRNKRDQYQGTVYFKSFDRVQEAINTIGEDAIKELFLNPNQMQGEIK